MSFRGGSRGRGNSFGGGRGGTGYAGRGGCIFILWLSQRMTIIDRTESDGASQDEAGFNPTDLLRPCSVRTDPASHDFDRVVTDALMDDRDGDLCSRMRRGDGVRIHQPKDTLLQRTHLSREQGRIDASPSKRTRND